MSFGFQLFDENGGLALDDKSFSIVGRDMVLGGKGSFPLYPEFIALGVSGAQLVGKGIIWEINGNSVVYEVLDGKTLTAVVFDDSSKSVAYPVMGLEIFNESGLKTFSSGDRHFEIISASSTRGGTGGAHREPLDRGVIYILHSVFWYVIGLFAVGAGVNGAVLGMDYLAATSTTLALGQRETWRIPVNNWAEHAPNPQYSSQIIRVRAK
ncbi:MAG TPA: hypothetical protein VFC74_03145 [Oscillospiraceae bacterium]|nr:hypothetical protein [Oscillospiraceae bacterium]